MRLSQMLPPGLADAIHGAGQQGPPPELLAALHAAALHAAAQGGQGPPQQSQGKPGIDDPAFAVIVQKLKEIAAGEPDHADAEKLLKLIAGLSGLIAGRQDATMTAMGGNPKQMRTMARAYGG